VVTGAVVAAIRELSGQESAEGYHAVPAVG
jgi:hypothetical protein